MRQKNVFFEYTEILIYAVVLALIIRAFVVQAYTIPSGSMLETLQIGDFLLVTRYNYDIKVPFTDKSLIRTSDPQRGDIIVFRYPKDTNINYIKRVVAVPGDVVEMRDKQFYRNGEKVDEPYIKHTDAYNVKPQRDTMSPRTVPEDQYFTMGDNRDNSEDSRFWGFVPRDHIQGKAQIIYLSWESPFSNIRWNRLGMLLR